VTLKLSDNETELDATVRNLGLNVEAASQFPESVRASNPQQMPWRMIVATRNRLIHGYLGIEIEQTRTRQTNHEDHINQGPRTAEPSVPAFRLFSGLGASAIGHSG